MSKHVIVAIGSCLGLARDEAIGAAVNLVLQRPDGGLHVLSMSGPTALAMVAAIRADISAPIEDQHLAMGAQPMAIWPMLDVAPAALASIEPPADGSVTHAILDLFQWANGALADSERKTRVIRWALGLSILVLGFMAIGLASGRI